MKIRQGVFAVGELVMVKSEVVLEVGKSPKVVKGSDDVRVVGLEYLPTHPALNKEGQVVARKVITQVWVVIHTVLDFHCIICRDLR